MNEIFDSRHHARTPVKSLYVHPIHVSPQIEADNQMRMNLLEDKSMSTAQIEANRLETELFEETALLSTVSIYCETKLSHHHTCLPE